MSAHLADDPSIGEMDRIPPDPQTHSIKPCLGLFMIRCGDPSEFPGDDPPLNAGGYA